MAWNFGELSFLGFSQLLKSLGFCFSGEIWEVFSHCFFEYFFSPTLFSPFSGTPVRQMLELLLESHTFLKLLPPHTLCLLFCCLDWLISIVFSSNSYSFLVVGGKSLHLTVKLIHWLFSHVSSKISIMSFILLLFFFFSFLLQHSVSLVPNVFIAVGWIIFMLVALHLSHPSWHLLIVLSHSV